jgi:hypothetical protein
MMTKQQLHDALKRCEKASKGPWEHALMVKEGGEPWNSAEEIAEYVCNCIKSGKSLDFYFVSAEKEDGRADVCHVGNGPTSPENCHFIAKARTDLPAALEALQEAVKILRYFRDLDKLARAHTMAVGFLAAYEATTPQEKRNL